MKAPPIFSVLLFLLMLLLAAAATPTVGDEPDEVVLSVRSDVRSCPLGSKVSLEIRLSKRRGKPAEVAALRLARNSLSLRIEVGGATYEVTRIYGENVRGPDGGWMLRDKPPPRATLRRGQPLAETVPFFAVLPGETTVRAVYRGFAAGSGEFVSEPLVVSVEPDGDKRVAAMMRTSEGVLTIRLLPERAFNTVQNFLALADSGRYDGLTFHRIVPPLFVQGGDPKGNGQGGPGWTIPPEWHEDLRHVRGTVSMARAEPPDSAGSQFFIMLGEDSGLDGKYAVFGEVADGDETLDRLSAVELLPPSGTEKSTTPREPPVIQSVTPVLR